MHNQLQTRTRAVVKHIKSLSGAQSAQGFSAQAWLLPGAKACSLASSHEVNLQLLIELRHVLYRNVHSPSASVAGTVLLYGKYMAIDNRPEQGVNEMLILFRRCKDKENT
jgi:hypothetical protein